MKALVEASVSGRPKAQPPPLNLKKNYPISTSLLDTRWDYGNDHADWPSWYICAVNQHAFSMPSGRLALVNKACTSTRPDGMVIDRSVGQYYNTRLF